jgi:hypothetical protein
VNVTEIIVDNLPNILRHTQVTSLNGGLYLVSTAELDDEYVAEQNTLATMYNILAEQEDVHFRLAMIPETARYETVVINVNDVSAPASLAILHAQYETGARRNHDTLIMDALTLSWSENEHTC